MTTSIAPPAPGSPLWTGSSRRPWSPGQRGLLLLGIGLQLALALLFGHSYDTRLFMATGYLVGAGHNPYVPQDLSAVFHRASFDMTTTVGYLPPWPLVLGLLYRGVYALVPDFLLYNIAIKLPVIAANVALALMVPTILQNLGSDLTVARRAYAFLLLNPLLLFFGAAWGQIDAIVALFSLMALVLLYAERRAGSAVLLALAVCLKPTALPLLPVAVVFLLDGSLRPAARYLAVFAGAALLFVVTPFLLLKWSPAPILENWNAHFTMSGTMSVTTVARVFRDPLELAQRSWLLGLAWIPALAVGILALRRGNRGFDVLLKQGTALVLVFFLTRTWLSEPNVILILPFMVILTSLGELDRRTLTAIWALPLAFALFNAAPLQLLFAAFPEAMDRSLAFVSRYHAGTLLARAILVIAWQVTGWWIVVACLRREGRAAWK